MNKTAVKNYAVEARKKWMQATQQQAAFYGCTESGCLSDADITKQLADKGIFLTGGEKAARSNLVDEINSKGYQNTIEEIAYTWFNRLIAIRFMEVNGYLPSGIRVLSSIDADRIEPDCVREYARLDFLNQDTAAKLAAESDERLYRYILVEQCNALGKIMPKMFTHIGGIAALLLPERLYIKDGLVYDLTHSISEEDFGEQVEIIGWLYQYYISEKKDEVFAALKKNVKITRENIPAATQLFTPDWIVKYMVENSLGRLWLEQLETQKTFDFNYVDFGNFSFGEDEDKSITKKQQALKDNWKYYIDEAPQEEAVQKQLYDLRMRNKNYDITKIKLIDPCMGSGHILVYAFDVLYQIYLSQGYSERDIPDLILDNNIYGLDIDERACQLAYFALMMKARSVSRRFFRREDVPQPQVYSPQGYEDGMEYGSLVKVDVLEDKPLEKEVATLFDTPYEVELNTWNFRRLLHQKYDVVVTNPPYMGASGMGNKLKKFLSSNYPESKGDTFSAFIEQGLFLAKSYAYSCMVTMQGWMTIASYEALRRKLIRNNTLCCLMEMDNMVMGIAFATAVSIFGKYKQVDYKGTYSKIKYSDIVDNAPLEFPIPENNHIAVADNFRNTPGAVIAYWVSNNILEILSKQPPLSNFADARKGLTTGDNNRFLRFWHEISTFNFSTGIKSTKFYAMTKGGKYRKWYGNNEYVVNWENDGFELKNFKDEDGNLRSVIRNVKYYLQECISWNDTTSTGKISFRYQAKGYIPNALGPCVYCNNREQLIYLLGLLNSCVSQTLLDILTPNMKFEVGQMALVPIIISEINVKSLVDGCVEIAKSDWDSFETSWDFQTHPLIAARGNYEEAQPLLVADDIAEGVVVTEWSKTSAPIAHAYDAWERETDRRFDTLKANEEELNRIFIDIYGLQDELTPEVADKDVTVRKADLGREIRSLISYAVGCMFGRYSLDTPGLAYAGGDWDASKYSSFIPENDNILPITDADYFDDDIVTRFVDFVKVVYGEDTLAENLAFIANALYPTANTTARESIRRYFQSDFFKDHCKIYQKRPIYWLFDSGKQNGFKALIYLHRYDKYTVARVRTEYLHPLQRKYEAEVERMNKLADLPETSARDKAEFKKQTEKIAKQITECRAYDQIISHMAAQTIELDLDDGVKVNYEKFQGVDVPRDDGKGTVKMDLLGKI